MIKLTKIVTNLQHWENPDIEKMGYIPVFYNHEIRLAKPLLPAMALKVPSKEWVEKYGEGIGIYVHPAEEDSGLLWYTGYCLFKGNSLFEDFDEEYPYMRISHFDESWLEYFSSYKGKTRWELKSTHEDYSSFKLDADGKVATINNRGINGIQFSENGSAILEKKSLELGGFGATEPAVLGNKLSQWLTDLLTAMSTETHLCSSPGSPSGPPLNAASYSSLQARIPEIVSLLVKISK